MDTDNKKLFSNGVVYIVISIITQLINLFLIPIYTRNLTTGQYGQFNIINSIESLISIFVTLGIFSGFSRFFNEYADKNKLKNIVFTFSIICSGIIITVVLLTNSYFAQFLFNEDLNGRSYINIVTLNSIVTSIISVYESYYAMQYKAIKASILSLANMVFKCLFASYFIIVLNKGILGILEAQLIASSLVLIILILRDIKNIRFVIVKEPLKNMLKFSIGLIPGNASAWILTLIDRYFIRNMINLRFVGIYSIAYKIGMLIETVFFSPFNRAFTPFKFNVYNHNDGKEKIKNVYDYFNFIGWFCILGLAIFSKILILILSTTEYLQGFKIVPIIAFSYYLYGLGSFYCIGFEIANKMYIDSIILIFASIINIIFNFVLIPLIGMYGAAISTIISYLFTNIIYYVFGNKYYKLDIGIFQPFKYAILYSGLYLIYLFYHKLIASIFIQLFLNVILCILYLILCIELRFISRDKVKYLIYRIRNKLKNKLANKKVE